MTTVAAYGRSNTVMAADCPSPVAAHRRTRRRMAERTMAITAKIARCQRHSPWPGPRHSGRCSPSRPAMTRSIWRGQCRARVRPRLGVPDRRAVPHQDSTHGALLRLGELGQRASGPVHLSGDSALKVEHRRALQPRGASRPLRWPSARCRSAAGSVPALGTPPRPHGPAPPPSNFDQAIQGVLKKGGPLRQHIQLRRRLDAPSLPYLLLRLEDVERRLALQDVGRGREITIDLLAERRQPAGEIALISALGANGSVKTRRKPGTSAARAATSATGIAAGAGDTGEVIAGDAWPDASPGRECTMRAKMKSQQGQHTVAAHPFEPFSGSVRRWHSPCPVRPRHVVTWPASPVRGEPLSKCTARRSCLEVYVTTALGYAPSRRWARIVGVGGGC